MQKCYRCGLYKSQEDFAWRRKAKNQRDSFCRQCRAAYHREHYLANRRRYIDQAEGLSAEQREKIFQGNACRVYPRLKARLAQRGRNAAS